MGEVKRLIHPVDRNIAWSLAASVLFAAVAVVTGPPTVLVLAVLGAAALAIRSALARGGALLSPRELQWMRPGALSHCLLLLEPPAPGLTALRELVRARVLARFPRFTQRVEARCGGYCWAPAPDFALAEHVLEEQCACSGSLRALLAELSHASLPRRRPLWEVRVLRDALGADAVLLVRVHQALGDAATFVALLSGHLADAPRPRQRPWRRFGAATLPLNAFRAVFVAPLTLLAWLRGGDKLPPPGPRSFAWHEPGLRLKRLLRIQRVMRCSLNDVFVAAAAGAVRAHFARSGVRNPPNVTLCLPVDVGRGSSPVRCRLPSGVEGCVPRMWEARRRAEELKASPDTAVALFAQHLLLTLLPAALAHPLLDALLGKATALLGNVSGPAEPLWLGGRRLRRMVWWMGGSETPLVFSLLSYAGGVGLAVSADANLCPNPQLLVAEFVAEVRRLSLLLSRRRIPGERRRRSHFTEERRLAEILGPPDTELHRRLAQVQARLSSEERLEEERLEELKEEFEELMRELRRRKSRGVLDEEEEEDGGLRPPWRLSLAGRRVSLQPRPPPTPHVVSTPDLHHAAQDRSGRRKSDFN